jgi:trehalose 6-phosphate phosphatase
MLELPVDAALFLDVDGTLVEFSLDPASVRLDPTLLGQIDLLAGKLQGALALLSGRRIDDLDRLFAPLVLPCGGLHGLERRDAAGTIHSAPPALTALRWPRTRLIDFVAAHPALLLEDKGEALALHYRRAPELGAAVQAVMQEIAVALGAGYHVQAGHFVCEVKSRSQTKGTALRAFMQEVPFGGRVPVAVGDDATDRDAFAAAESLGGLAISVGPVERARWNFSAPGALRAWLAAAADRG